MAALFGMEFTAKVRSIICNRQPIHNIYINLSLTEKEDYAQGIFTIVVSSTGRRLFFKILSGNINQFEMLIEDSKSSEKISLISLLIRFIEISFENMPSDLQYIETFKAINEAIALACF